MELSLFIKTLALGIFMNSSNMPGSPYDRVFDLSFQGDLLSASRVWERTNGIEYSGERIYAKSPKWNGALLELEHFRRSAQSINTQSSRLIYQFIGYEIVYFDYFKNPKNLFWIGHSRKIKNVDVRFSYSSDFSGFEKSDISIAYKKLVGDKLFVKPSFENSRIENLEFWKLMVSFEYEIGPLED